MKKAQVTNTLNRAGVYPDRLTANQDGSFTFKRSYFYHHNETPELWAEKIQKAIPQAKIVQTRDAFARWPKTSYFVVNFTA